MRLDCSDMISNVDSDSACLVAPGAKACITNFYFKHAPDRIFFRSNNYLIHVECRYPLHVVVSTVESGVGALFQHFQTAISIQNCIIFMWNHQPPPFTKTDNTTTRNLTYNNIALKTVKSWDMRYYWLRDRDNQLHFNFFGERDRSRRSKQS